MALTPKRALFVQHYLRNGFNGTQAAISAGYGAKNADVEAHRLLGNAEILAAIKKGRAKLEKTVELEASSILRELGRLGLSDIGSAFDDRGRILPIHEMPEGTRRAIASIDVEETPDFSAEMNEDGSMPFKCRVAKVKLWDKNKSLELLGKYFKLYTEKIEHSGDGPVTVVINGITADPKGKKP